MVKFESRPRPEEGRVQVKTETKSGSNPSQDEKVNNNWVNKETRRCQVWVRTEIGNTLEYSSFVNE